MQNNGLALRAFAALVILEGFFTLFYSTDESPIFLALRALRIIVASMLLFGMLPNGLLSGKLLGTYFMAESMVSFLISPDKASLPFEVGWGLRFIFGTYLFTSA